MQVEDNIEPVRPHSCLVMLVDDQPMVAEALRRILVTEADMDFHYCQDPCKAAKTAEHVKPTIILLDLVMPEIDGMAILRYLRANPPTKNIPVVMLSSREDAQMKADAFTSGGNDYLIKWPDRIELLARIRYHSQCFINLQQRDEAFRALRVSQRKLAETNLELQRIASLDGLTGIPNRRFFDEILEKEWLRAAREQDWISVVMMDIDHFKQYNDLYGHPGGDACLRSVALTLGATLKRPTDLAARYGGEEFVLVLPNTNAEGALLIAEKIRQDVAALTIIHAGVAAQVTISLGVATTIPEHGSLPASLLAEADAALYSAKHNGRNRVVLAPVMRV